MDKDFYYIEMPKGHNEFMLFAKFDNMPPQSYHGTKKRMEEIKAALNEKLNKAYIVEGFPEMFFKSSTPKKFRVF